MTVYQWLSLAGVPSLIVLVFTIVLKKMASRRDKKQEEIRQQNKQLETQSKAMMLGVQALLRDRLLQAFKFYISQGYADYSDRDNVKNMFVQYEALGPNSVMQDLYEQFTNLPMQL